MKIYFCGSMTCGREKQENYEQVINYLKKFGSVLNEFVADKIVKDYEPSVVFKRDYTNMNSADICIADISVPSTGVGFELGMMYNLNVKTLVLYDENMKLPSSLPRGADKFVVKSYKTIEEEKDIIKNFIENL